MNTSIKWLHWTPRVIVILAIAFVSLFAADAFEPGLGIWQQLGGFFMHLIPSFFLMAVLFVAWKYELIGGVIFTLLGLFLSPMVYTNNYYMNQSVGMSLGIVLSITFPFFLAGILFIISHYKKKRELQAGKKG